MEPHPVPGALGHLARALAQGLESRSQHPDSVRVLARIG